MDFSTPVLNSKTKEPKVFVIILNYNGKDCLMTTLKSVFQLNYSNFEVILVDNASKDGSFEMAKGAFPRAIFIRNSENLGFSAGNNVGIRYALERGADYVFLLNYDATADQDALSRLIETTENDKKIGLASPTIRNGASHDIWFSGGQIDWLRMKTRHVQEQLTCDNFASDFITGCALLIRKEVFKKIGLLDEDYFLYWEDADFSVKAKRAGFKLLVSAKSFVTHFEKSEETKNHKTYWLVISGLLFFKKNCPLLLRPWIFLYTKARKIKNKRDMRSNATQLTRSVAKAYKDFRYAK